MFQNLACQEYNEVLHKDAAIMIIKVQLIIDIFKFSWTLCKLFVLCIVFMQGVIQAEKLRD